MVRMYDLYQSLPSESPPQAAVVTQNSPYPHRWKWLRRPPTSRPRIAFVDFDGTLSRIRAGWLPVMRAMMLQELCNRLGQPVTDEMVHEVNDWIASNNGKPTWHQMACLRSQLLERGCLAEAVETYLDQFHALLAAQTRPRLEDLAKENCPQDTWRVPGAGELLRELADRGFHLHLASGTEKAAVVRELALLGLDQWFGNDVSAPHQGDPSFTKESALLETCRKLGTSPAEALAIGDGPVEIEVTSRLGGWTLGVAGHEDNRQGFDPWVAGKLDQSGAHALVDHYTPAKQMLEWFLSGP